MIESIHEAVEILGLGEKATIIEINHNYKSMLFHWHPDHCDSDPDKCREMTEMIIEAYRTVTDYCNNYKFSFRKEDLEKNRKTDPEEFWFKKFGDDPLWGSHK